jgi:hypothetical protein
MGTASSILAVSIGMGGAIFIGLILFWFIRVYAKRRTGLNRPPCRPASAHPWEEKRSQPRLAVSWHAAFGTCGSRRRSSKT